MIIIQVLLGGITRLTGSGLSITEWKPIMGALPPMNDEAWNLAFQKYQQIAQFKYVNSHFTLGDFKFIFFWEWLHRLWARLIGVAFLIPFIIFIIQRRFKKEMIRPMIILFLLGGLQGLVGWIMVQSGLEDSELLYVSHYKLAIHFILALGLLCYTLWFAMDLLIPRSAIIINKPLRKFTIGVTTILILQLIYGAFMAGLHAATVAPTWPLINGSYAPSNVHTLGAMTYGGISFLFDNPLVVQFIHRNLAYLLLIGVITWFIKAKRIPGNDLFSRIRVIPVLLILLQAILGILTVLNALSAKAFLWLAVAHQFVAMLLLLSFIMIVYLVRKREAGF
jgi:cytochrome c oxidase assembly protein subunit 15